jgi:hypothetical protein
MRCEKPNNKQDAPGIGQTGSAAMLAELYLLHLEARLRAAAREPSRVVSGGRFVPAAPKSQAPKHDRQ